MRDHENITLEEFNGFWSRGGADSVPQDHWSDCNNVKFIESGFQTRDGINTFEPGYFNVLQVYNYKKLATESRLILDDAGNIYDDEFGTTPILTIAGMIDFGLSVFAGRAYITPTANKVHGMSNQFVYVYLGDGTPARKAAGQPPVNADGALAAANGAAGNVEAGVHVFGVVYETNTGFLTQIGPDTLPTVTAPGTDKVDLSAIPVSPNSYVTKRHIVATRAIDPTLYTGNTRGYQFFFLPDGVINDNTSTTLTVNFFDSELLDDASHLLDLFSEIPAGVGLTQYHGRLLVWTFQPDEEMALIRVSYPGEPEAFDQITGLISLQTSHQPITICRELRDVLYIFKLTQTFAVNDNGDVPSSWNVILLDNGLGASLHGIADVLDNDSITIDYLTITNFTGTFLFNGTFQFPELSYKIADYWTNFNFDDYENIEIYNDPVTKRYYIIQPDLVTMLMADYQHGLDYKSIRWTKWTFDFQPTCMCLTQVNKLIIGSHEGL